MSLSGSKNRSLEVKDVHRVFILNAPCIQSFCRMSSTHQGMACPLNVSSSIPKNACTPHYLHVSPQQPSWLFPSRLKFLRPPRFYGVSCRLFLKDNVDKHNTSEQNHEKRQLLKLVSEMLHYTHYI